MFDWKKPTVQMLGRWQPWHDGHQALFKRCVAKTGQVIIQVRDVQGASGGDGQDDNPFKNINPVNILSDIFSEIENPAIISSQNYDYEINADINSENLKSLVGDIIVTNKNVHLSLNINQDGIVDSIKIYGIVQPNDSIDTQREIKFERWNENLKWETP